MGTLDHFWSFKLLLQDKQEQEEEAEVDSDPGSAMPRPFLAEAGRNQRTTKPDGENVLMAQYLQSAWPETVTAPDESTKVVPNQEAPRASPPPPPEVEFVPPTKKQLDGLTIFELRKLRREIALQIHPDLAGKQRQQVDENVMGRCNQMIDAAIQQKSAK